MPAVALTACYALAFAGARLVRDPGAMARLASGGQELPLEPVADAAPSGPIGRMSARLAPPLMRILGRSRLEAARRRLEAAGRPGGLTVEGYVGRKATFTILMGGVGVLFLLDGNLFGFAVSTVAGWLWMDVWVAGMARRRQAQIDRDLPDFLDVVSVTVRAGSGLRAALSRVSEALGGPLGEEMLIALRQMDLGSGRRQAFEDLRRRNTSEPLGQFVTALLQAEELGVPLSDAITNLAADMRRVYHQEARRRAAKADPRVNLIVTTLIVPGAIILILTALLAGSDIDLGNLFGPR
jgi:tight adherence protein C